MVTGQDIHGVDIASQLAGGNERTLLGEDHLEAQDIHGIDIASWLTCGE
jgi:hypothetical protein